MTEFQAGLTVGTIIGVLLGVAVGLYLISEAKRINAGTNRALKIAARQRLADQTTIGQQKDLIHELMVDVRKHAQ